VFTYDVGRATLTRLTTHAAQDRGPLWTRNGDRIVFSSNRSGFPELFSRRADGSGYEERVLTRGKNLIELFANGWSPDGSQMLFTEVRPSTQGAIGQVATTAGAETTMLVRNEFSNGQPAVSQDGRWLAYSSTLSGREEIYVERYPELRDRQQISTNGGRLPMWSRDGRELFFSSLDGRQMLAVPVRSGTTLVAGRPGLLFEGPYAAANYGAWPYDLFPDGRFVMIKLGAAPSDTASAPNLVIVQNWAEGLKRLVPTN
jgi:serine/threonine-protein kinase